MARSTGGSGGGAEDRQNGPSSSPGSPLSPPGQRRNSRNQISSEASVYLMELADSKNTQLDHDIQARRLTREAIGDRDHESDAEDSVKVSSRGACATQFWTSIRERLTQRFPEVSPTIPIKYLRQHYNAKNKKRKMNAREGAWSSKEEDALWKALADSTSTDEKRDWSIISKAVGTRTPRQCRCKVHNSTIRAEKRRVERHEKEIKRGREVKKPALPGPPPPDQKRACVGGNMIDGMEEGDDGAEPRITAVTAVSVKTEKGVKTERAGGRVSKI
ncbi:hypothetical protein KIPB_004581 [Kipferlia bialata]|uniref:Myb-like domain-containing protein n=1 Tax=Kipferlia bialata TaxID=797122 RepID=A0A9K3CX53_9EUKA|nr:hypothetical protein KIPB_004581 [Kipferlia bialata]|eukprot:g4581.t1